METVRVAAVPSPATQALGAAAARFGVWLSIGCDEKDRHSSTHYNSQLLFDADGRLVQCHRKLMPTGGERPVWGFGDGSTLGVVARARTSRAQFDPVGHYGRADVFR